VRFSFEVFPPRTSEAACGLRETVVQLGALDPLFVSVTYGAGGSDRHRSFDTIRSVAATGATVAGHLTCVGQSVADVESVIERYAALGVEHVVALRGDPPEGVGATYQPHPDGYRRTADLVAAVKARGRFDVAVSAYPERHPQSPTVDHDLDVLAEKVGAGADRAITQMFFDNDDFLRYRDRVDARGIDVELVPGIFPIHSFPAVSRFAERCGARMPRHVADRFEGIDTDSPAHTAAASAVAAEIAAEQIAELATDGIRHVHLYTLNRAALVLDVCERLLHEPLPV
jgi:methylenetetrahydrofolate reductase (NADPH)